MEVLPCSRIAHLERAHKPYLPDLSIAMKRNALRVAEVWMDDYKYMVYFAWNIPVEVAMFLCVSNCVSVWRHSVVIRVALEKKYY